MLAKSRKEKTRKKQISKILQHTNVKWRSFSRFFFSRFGQQSRVTLLVIHCVVSFNWMLRKCIPEVFWKWSFSHNSGIAPSRSIGNAVPLTVNRRYSSAHYNNSIPLSKNMMEIFPTLVVPRVSGHAVYIMGLGDIWSRNHCTRPSIRSDCQSIR